MFKQSLLCQGTNITKTMKLIFLVVWMESTSCNVHKTHDTFELRAHETHDTIEPHAHEIHDTIEPRAHILGGRLLPKRQKNKFLSMFVFVMFVP